MGIITSISEAKQELDNLGVYVSELEIVDWDEVFEHAPDSDQIKQEIVDAIYKLSDSVKRFKAALK